MKLFLVSDAWKPQVNGVVRTLNRMIQEMEARGHEIEVAGPRDFNNMPCPTYPEIELALFPSKALIKRIEAFQPNAIHIATEGPLGHAARKYCLRNNMPFTTAYHTRFPEYIHARTRLPLSLSYGFLRKFHAKAERCMVATNSIQQSLEERGFTNIVRWGRGVDTEQFQPVERSFLPYPGPISLYVGRVAIEKNIPAFLDLELPGTKVVVGDGPLLAKLRAQYPDVIFKGALKDDDLTKAYAAADVFVFPSKTDTFGLVMLEALACGTPVAGYPVPGPIDVISDQSIGGLDFDLAKAVDRALTCPREACRDFAVKNNWDVCVEQFMENLSPV